MSVEHEQPVEMKILYKYVHICIGARAHLEKTNNALLLYYYYEASVSLRADVGVILDVSYVKYYNLRRTLCEVCVPITAIRIYIAHRCVTNEEYCRCRNIMRQRQCNVTSTDLALRL